MILSSFIYLLITGAVVGLASGMLGVGGCFIMIPVQFWLLTSVGVPVDIAIKVAFGTNLLVVFPTAISGAYGHTKKGSVLWKQGIILGVTGFFGSMIGASIASKLPGNILKLVFGLIVIASAIRMLTAKPLKENEEPSNNTLLYIILGVPIGIICGIVGIGGGVVSIPIMVTFLKFKMHKAVGTASVLMIFISIGGALSYMLNGLSENNLPAYSIGYVNFLFFIILAGASVPMALVGAKIAHRMPGKQLKLLFIIIMLYMGLKMTGIFQLLNLPI